ncbi:MAG: sterol desaturase family protein [Candidatus Obscuribacterales bacterium]|nr:sterol desaturase family protein [Candidatus Obscuribacterales bacterium]
MPVDTLSQCAQRLTPLILLVYMVFICVEMAADHFLKTKAYNFDDTLHNLIMFFVNRMTGGLGGAFMFSMLSLTAHFAPWKLHGPFAWIVTFLVVDMLFYIQHRCFHTDTIFAPFHEVHHSSQNYNLTTTLRASVFLPWLNPLFYFSAALIGCDPLAIIISFSLIQVYQFFLHTEFVPSLGLLEGIINTPSAHRVHHGHEQAQYESNLGGVLLLWDRIFKSYMAEPEHLLYGIKGVAVESNFFVAQLKPFVSFAARRLKQNQTEFHQ